MMTSSGEYRGIDFPEETMDALLKCVHHELAPDEDHIIQPDDNLIRDLEAEQAFIWDTWFRMAKIAGFNPLRFRKTQTNALIKSTLQKNGTWNAWSGNIKHTQRILGIKLVAGAEKSAMQEDEQHACARTIEFMPDDDDHIVWRNIHELMDSTEPLTVERLIWIVHDACKGTMAQREHSRPLWEIWQLRIRAALKNLQKSTPSH